jgi:hypothetical protein
VDGLRQFVVEIDLNSAKVTFSDAPRANAGVPFRMTNRPNESPCVTAQIAGAKKESFILDTGMIGHASGALNAQLFESPLANGDLQLEGASIDQSVAGRSHQRKGRLKDLALGPFFHRERLDFAQQKENLLGLNYLSRFVVTLDFPNQMIYLQKGKKFDSFDLQDKSGLHIVRQNGKPVVEIN